MVRNIVMVLVVCLLLGLVVYEVRKHQEKVQLDSGAFTCQGCLSPTEKERYDKEDHGETADGNSERKAASARVAAQQATAGTSSAPPGVAGSGTAAAGATATSADAFSNKGAGTSSMVPPAQGTYGAGSSQPVVVPTTGQPGATPMGVPPSQPTGLPTTDSQAANAPNGLRFGGSGSYQWYRQGNLTWRVDTASGRSCIVYATIEEWRKPIVMSHGCGGNA